MVDMMNLTTGNFEYSTKLILNLIHISCLGIPLSEETQEEYNVHPGQLRCAQDVGVRLDTAKSGGKKVGGGGVGLEMGWDGLEG